MQSFHLDWGYGLFSTLVLALDYSIRIGLSLRVIMRKRPYGITLAWLVVIQLLPLIGAILYLLFGENRLPDRRITRARSAQDIYLSWLSSLQDRAPERWPTETGAQIDPIHQQALRLVGIPALAGNDLQLLTCPKDILTAICGDIDRAEVTCHLEFYIWQDGGLVDEIIEALTRAAARGVACRILLDGIGSRRFLRSDRARKLHRAGVSVRESLPAGLLRMLFSRIDIRNHRKLVVIDGTIAYTGSQNMVDPAFFKQDAGVGNWVDVMVRIAGPVVEVLGGMFLNDWYLESSDAELLHASVGETVEEIRRIGNIHPLPPCGDTPVQLVPSGPGFVPEAIHSLLLTTIYAARHELLMTTPYFIPDEPILAALKAAAQRGVDVRIILPARNDSTLVHFASRARYEELCEAGVRFFLFSGGLLHAKTVTVDGRIALFGSVNLDMRSFWLNFEMTLFIYCPRFSGRQRATQLDYLQLSSELDPASFKERGYLEKFKENACLLISPLL